VHHPISTKPNNTSYVHLLSRIADAKVPDYNGLELLFALDEIASLDFVINRFFVKLFQTNNIEMGDFAGSCSALNDHHIVFFKRKPFLW